MYTVSGTRWRKLMTVCGEAGSMAKGVERVLAEILGSAMGSADDGAKALKMLRERSRVSSGCCSALIRS